MPMREIVGNVVAWWRRQSSHVKRRLLIRTGAVALGVVAGSIIVAKLTWGSRGPGLVTPFAFAGLFLAAAILFVLAVLSSEELVDEMESSHPPRVRRRGVYQRAMRRNARIARRSFAVWLAWVGPTLRRHVTRASVTQGLRGIVDALSGVPPAGTSVRHAGPLARPLAAAERPPAAHFSADELADRRLRLIRGGAPSMAARSRVEPRAQSRTVRRVEARPSGRSGRRRSATVAARRRGSRGSGRRS
jgi:hypothetical protein